MGLIAERFSPVIISSLIGIAGAIASFSGVSWPVPDTNMLGIGITVSAIFAGFDSVYRNNLLELQSKALKALNRTNLKQDLHSYISASMSSSMLVITYSFILLCFPEENIKTLHTTLRGLDFVIWLALIVFMLLCFRRIHSIMNKLYVSDKRNK